MSVSIRVNPRLVSQPQSMGLPRGGLDGVDFAEATKRAAEAIENGFIPYRQTEKAKLRGTSKRFGVPLVSRF